MVDEGSFRLDLYHRISALTVKTSPLRSRQEDIPALAAHFLRLMEEDVGPRTLADSAVTLLMEHPWPGNARSCGTCSTGRRR